jgi:hypothetical protein
VTINGTVNDLVIAQGAENGTVTLQSATVVGGVTVAGAGTTLNVSGSSTVNKITLAESAEGAKVTVAADASVKSISTEAEKTEISVAGTVGTISIADSADGTSVVAEAGGSINSVNVKADDVTVSGSGKVTSVTTSAANTAVNTSGTTVTATETASGTTANGKSVAAGTTVSTSSSGGGGGGSDSVSYDYNFAVDTATNTKLGVLYYYTVSYEDGDADVGDDDDDLDLKELPKGYNAADLPDQIRIVATPNLGVKVQGLTAKFNGTFVEDISPLQYTDGCWEIHLTKDVILEKGAGKWTFIADFDDLVEVYTFSLDTAFTSNANPGGTIKIYDASDLEGDFDGDPDTLEELTQIKDGTSFTEYQVPDRILVVYTPDIANGYVIDSVTGTHKGPTSDAEETDIKGGDGVSFNVNAYDLAEDLMYGKPSWIDLKNPKAFADGDFVFGGSFKCIFDTTDNSSKKYKIDVTSEDTDCEINLSKKGFDSVDELYKVDDDTYAVKIYVTPVDDHDIQWITVTDPNEKVSLVQNYTDTTAGYIGTMYLNSADLPTDGGTWKVNVVFKALDFADVDEYILSSDTRVAIVKFGDEAKANYSSFKDYESAPDTIAVTITTLDGYAVDELSYIVADDDADAAQTKLDVDIKSAGDNKYTVSIPKDIFNNGYDIRLIVQVKPVSAS